MIYVKVVAVAAVAVALTVALTHDVCQLPQQPYTDTFHPLKINEEEK